MKVALVYDRINKFGGAERILLALHKIFPDAPLYTSVYNSDTAPWAKVFTIKTSFLQNFPFAKNNHEWFAPLMPLAFESFSFAEYDLVISVTSEAAKGIITTGKTKHICYILTPTRYLWSGYHEYFKNTLFRVLSYPIVWYLQRWDRIVAKRPNKYIAISSEVQKRVNTYYHEKSSVVYPAVEIETSSSFEPSEKGYFLIVSRLVSYKRINLAIQACNELKLPLKIIGTGSEEQKLKSISGSTIEFLGSLTDDEVVGYYRNCCALLFPGDEDLGLTIIEAQLLGKPVIAYKGGGALETIIGGKTGEFFYPQASKALKEVIQNFDSNKYKQDVCQKNGEQFSFKRFKKEFIHKISQAFPEIKI